MLHPCEGEHPECFLLAAVSTSDNTAPIHELNVVLDTNCFLNRSGLAIPIKKGKYQPEKDLFSEEMDNK